MANIERTETLINEKGIPYIRTYFDDGTHFDPTEVSRTLSSKAYDVIEKLENTTFYIEDYMTSREDYQAFLEDLRNDLREGFEFEEFRFYPVYFKFYHADEDMEVLPFNLFVFNVTIWHPLVCIAEEYPEAAKFNKMMIITQDLAPKVNAKLIRNYMNSWDINPYRRYVDIRHMNRIIGKTQYLMTRIPVIFAPFLGITCNLDMFLEQEDLNPEYKRMVRFKLDTSLQPAEMEKAHNEGTKHHINLLMTTPYYNQFQSLLQDIKQKQFGEIQTSIGLKPNANGETIETPINENWLYGDIGSVQKFTINCISGRKAAIINNEYMGSTGHFLIMVAIASNATKLSKTTIDCGTVNPVSLEVKTKDHLRKINGRRYRIGNGSYHTIDADKDTDLIGKRIWLRTPVTCACKDGICRECYGDLYYVNRTLNSAGELGALIVMNPVTQMILSAKHAQGTKSEPIVFNEDFNKFFMISQTDIIVNPNIDDIIGYRIAIRLSDIKTTSSDDDDLERMLTAKRKSRRYKAKTDDDSEDNGDEGFHYYTNRFYVIKTAPKKGQPPLEMYEFEDKDSKNLMMTDEFVRKLTLSAAENNGEFLSIDMDELDASDLVFNVVVENEELTKPVKSIERLINNKAHEGCDDIDSMVQKMLDLIVEAGLDAMSVHGEMILYKLIRKANRPLQRPNFRLPVLREDYMLDSITTSLKRDPSISTSLSTPYLKYQFIQEPTTFEKTATSDYDEMFRLYIEEEDSVPVTRYVENDVIHNPSTWDFFNGYNAIAKLDRSES